MATLSANGCGEVRVTGNRCGEGGPAVALYLQFAAVSCGLVQFGAENGVGRGEVSAVNCSDVGVGWGFDAGVWRLRRGGCLAGFAAAIGLSRVHRFRFVRSRVGLAQDRAEEATQPSH